MKCSEVQLKCNSSEVPQNITEKKKKLLGHNEVSPSAPKKSFPKKGKPGRLAKTIILKSGCMTMTLGISVAPKCGKYNKKQMKNVEINNSYSSNAYLFLPVTERINSTYTL